MFERSFRIDTAGLSHVGNVRKLNEDSYITRPEIGLWSVADGMGGHDAGDFASQSVVEALARLPKPRSAPELLGSFEQAVLDTNRMIRAEAQSRGAHSVIGCTLVVLIIFGDVYACVWSGDSRIYRIRGHRIEQITRDHTEVQELLDSGVLTPAEAASWPRKNVITRAIGVADEPELEMVQGRLEDGDIFLLCSDGLTGHVEDQEILAESASTRSLNRFCERLIELTLLRGAKDNVTVVAVSCREVTNVRLAEAPGEGSPDGME